MEWFINVLFVLTVITGSVGVLLFFASLAFMSKGFEEMIFTAYEWSDKERESIDKLKVVGAGLTLLNSFYGVNSTEKLPKISIKKVALIALVLNIYFFIVASSQDVSAIGGSGIYLTMFTVSLLSSNFISEIVSYLITRHYLNKASENNNIIYVAYDVILLMIMYIGGVMLMYYLGDLLSREMLFIFIGILPVASSISLIGLLEISSMNNGHISLLLIPSILSISLPTACLVMAGFLVYNRPTLNKITYLLKTYSEHTWKSLFKKSQIVLGSSALFAGILGGLAAYNTFV